jgi:hypothetical protein
MSRQLLIKTESMIWRYRDDVPVALTMVLLLVALRGYSDSRTWRLGPPLGSTMDHDFRAVLRAARAIQTGDNPYAPALAFGRSPSFQQFLTWQVAPYPYPPLVAILAGALLVFPHNQSVRGLALRAFTTNAYNEPLHGVPCLGFAVPILIGLLAVGSWMASISHADDRTESVGSVEYGLTVTTALLVLPLVSDLHFVWVLAPISALLLVMIDNLRSINGLLLLAVCFVVAL